MHKVKLFDPRDAAFDQHGDEVSDPSVVERLGQWQMFVAGQRGSQGETDIFSATLPPGDPLSGLGWKLDRDASGALRAIAGRRLSAGWDLKGGRHCPSHVRGRDPRSNREVERVYYAGAADSMAGPYAIGFVEWDGEHWLDQPKPAFVANEPWEHASVFEPNVIYHDGKWKLWYVAGSIRDQHLVHGYAESEDGVSGWSKHEVFASAEMGMFDFCVRPHQAGFEAIFCRWGFERSQAPRDNVGMWSCRCDAPSRKLADWSKPVLILNGDDCGWHSGTWKPSFQMMGDRAMIFFSARYRTNDPGPFPYVFTLGRLDLVLPLCDGDGRPM